MDMERMLQNLSKNAEAVREGRAFDNVDPVHEGGEIRLPSLGAAKLLDDVPGASTIGANAAAAVQTHAEYVKLSVRQANAAPLATEQRSPPSDVGNVLAYRVTGAGVQEYGAPGNMVGITCSRQEQFQLQAR